METEFQEKEMSKRAKRIVEAAVPPDSQLAREFKIIRFNKRFRDRVYDAAGKLDLSKAYPMLGIENQETALLRVCVEWNLTEEEIHELIKHRYRQCYGPKERNQYGPFGGMNMTLSEYPKWCAHFGITPDPSFPDWGDRERAKKSLDDFDKALEQRVQKP